MIAFILGLLLLVIIWRACQPRSGGEITIVVRSCLKRNGRQQSHPFVS